MTNERDLGKLEEMVTYADLIDFGRSLEEFLAKSGGKKITLKALEKEIDYKDFQYFQKWFEGGKNTDIKEAMRRIIEMSRSAEPVRLTFAFEPKKRFLKKVSAWFGSLLGRKIFIDWDVDKSIIGGAVIKYRGVYRDYSVKRDLDEFNYSDCLK